jgi:hypothetical protein
MNHPIELCIPRVSIDIERHKIFETFVKLDIGYIERIIENPLKSDANYKRVVIRIKWDNTKELSKQIQDTLHENKHVNLVYEMPWFWKIYANKHKRN